MNKENQPQREIKKHKEPDYAREELEKGEFGIGYFGGQTFLFVPKSISPTFNIQRLRILAEQVFGKTALDEFHCSYFDGYELSYFVELPPQQNRHENLVTKLVGVIKEDTKNG